MNDRGRLIVISGPSGAGKSTVVFKAIENREDICFSTSVTTRKPRPGEVDGREYFFVDLDRFKEMVEKDELLEHAVYVANSYGTPRAYVERQMAAGLNVLLDIEVQGARQIHEKMPEAVMIFIVPPSMAVLRERLIGRGTEDMATVEKRLAKAVDEIRCADRFDYLVINDSLDDAVRDFADIMDACEKGDEARLAALREKTARLKEQIAREFLG